MNNCRKIKKNYSIAIYSNRMFNLLIANSLHWVLFTLTFRETKANMLSPTYPVGRKSLYITPRIVFFLFFCFFVLFFCFALFLFLFCIVLLLTRVKPWKVYSKREQHAMSSLKPFSFMRELSELSAHYDLICAFSSRKISAITSITMTLFNLAQCILL